MKITNKYGLPQVFVNALESAPYTKGKAHISVTELINSPRIVQLKRKHWDELEEDVADRVFALFGTAVHLILEQGQEDGSIVEERLHLDMDGWHISGGIDYQRMGENGVIIQDYKATGVWGVMYDKIEWEQQLNIYAYLVRKVKKLPVQELSIVAIIKDWSKRDAEIRENYPQAPVAVIPINLWDESDQERFIKDRIQLHSNAHLATEMGEDYQFCTPSEMWKTKTVYAVRKIGNVRAKALCATTEEAEEKLESLGKGYEIEIRKGERKRCKDYCQVSKFCNQYQNYLREES